MSDEQMQNLIRAYHLDPDDIVVATRLIGALLRERNGEEIGEASRAVAFFIECRTGCSCCSSENHFTGPWRSLIRAKEEVVSYTASRRLASQYARNGHYSISWEEAKICPDGRIIVDDRIFGGFSDDPDYESFNEQIDGDDFYAGSTNLVKGSEKKGWNSPLPDWYVDPDALPTETLEGETA